LPAKTATRSHLQQPRLLALAILFLFFLTAALSLADGTRLHSEQLQPDWQFFIPFFVWLGGILVLNKAVRHKLPNRDPWIFPTFAALIGWGLLTVWRLSPSLGQKQLGWYLLGCVIFWLGLNIQPPDLYSETLQVCLASDRLVIDWDDFPRRGEPNRRWTAIVAERIWVLLPAF